MKDEVPSQTSLMVALFIIILGGDAYGRQFLPPGCLQAQVELQKESHLTYGRFIWFICNFITSKLLRWVVNFFAGNPKFVESFGFRKIWIEQQTRKALKETGATQVLILAAGYDTLAYRLAPEFEHVSFVEVDHPATSKVKVSGLSKMKSSSNMHVLPADLTKLKLSDVLTRRIFYDPTKPTVVIMEGLTMYLTEDIIRELFGEIAKVVGHGSLALIDFYGWSKTTQTLDVGPLSLIWVFILQLMGESLYWGLDPTKIGEFFSVTKWRQATPVTSFGLENLVGLALKDDK